MAEAEEGGDSSTFLEAMREEMANMPLSELKEMQEKLGLKAFNKLKHGLDTQRSKVKTFKRENKNRPMEISARKPAPKKVVTQKDKLKRDPRFDDISGEFNERIFRQTYGFISDVKAKEKVKLKKQISKTKDKQKRIELKQLYNRMLQQEQNELRKAKKEELEKEWKKQERERVKEGKKPYFLKKTEKKVRLEAELRKDDPETSSKTDKRIAKRQKKIASKEKKKKAWIAKDI